MSILEVEQSIYAIFFDVQQIFVRVRVPNPKLMKHIQVHMGERPVPCSENVSMALAEASDLLSQEPKEYPLTVLSFLGQQPQN